MIKIAKGQVGQALTSSADNHIIAVAADIYDEELQEYQTVINQNTKEQLTWQHNGQQYG